MGKIFKVFQFYKRKSREDSLSASLKRVILSIAVVATAAFLVAMYVVVQKERIEYTKRESDSVLKTLSNNIFSEIKNYTEISRIIMTDERLVEFLRADSVAVDIGMINDARYGIMDILNVKEGVDCVMVFREDMIMVATNRFTYKYDYDRMNEEEWRKDIYEGKGKAVVSLHSNGIAEKLDNKPMVTIGRAVYDIDSQQRTGLMMMNISTIVFDRILGKLGYGDICIMGKDGSFLSGNRNYMQFFDEMFFSEKISSLDTVYNKEKVLVSGCSVSNIPIVIIRVSPYDKEGISFGMVYVLLGLLIVFIILASFVGWFIRKNITTPVFELSESMEKNRESGELKKIDLNVPHSEFEMLKGDYNNMIDHVNELIATLIEKEKVLQKSEMRVLQEQIKPHFLYNSLETIGFLAMDAGADKVHDALETLGRFYRNFLSKGGREIPLSREVMIVQDYLSLQKLRYGDIISDEYDIAPETENCIVPKLILQPLVENSIYHGIRLKGEEGTIRVSSKMVDGRLNITVRDTGVGMSRQQIDMILSAETDSEVSQSDSFGLWGTIQRVRIYTGRRDVVQISSEVGEYTEVTFVL
jgi:two-component system sensor histidine kinase YesM